MLFWQALKNQNRLADLDLVAISKQALPNRHIVYEGAVPAIEILDQKSLAIPSNHGVPSRYKRVQQHDLVRWLATYRQLVFGKREDLALEGAGQRFQPSWTGAGVLRIVIALHPTSIPTAHVRLRITKIRGPPTFLLVRGGTRAGGTPAPPATLSVISILLNTKHAGDI